ncbi:MAG: hypothetical protein A2Z99_10710 [Treponema sp. GWB1_62_6]|nr:MAG: hypothetical protein A2Z99_10710 [Treponema sp. GWB1_62_6]OHE63453.1 MAG: hypothetical protein A2001_03300 [Treponema sp. GWC1_61_84]OHE68563.1 MAG: hypothetical protein A2413_12495 [Treponema sp. RIFOXYC1_FULL_61_9]
MIHGLASVRAAVRHEAGALFGTAKIAGQLLRAEGKTPDQAFVIVGGVHEAGDMPLRNDEEVDRRTRGDVVEGENLVVLINLPARNLSPRDSAEQAVGLFHPAIISRRQSADPWNQING